jgi:hypothetical protein
MVPQGRSATNASGSNTQALREITPIEEHTMKKQGMIKRAVKGVAKTVGPIVVAAAAQAASEYLAKKAESMSRKDEPTRKGKSTARKTKKTTAKKADTKQKSKTGA